VLGLVLIGGCTTNALHERAWHVVETAHFRVVSSLEKESSLRIASDAEYFRAASAYVVGKPLRAAPRRTLIYAFDGRGITRPFAIHNEPGYLLTALGGATIVLRTGGGWRGDATPDLRHEYVHFLLRNRDGLERPLWYDEGVSQFASTIESVRAGASIGRPRADHVRLLRERLGISVDFIIGRRSLQGLNHREIEIFDAVSWGFVHLLVNQLGRGNPAAFRAGSERYMQLTQQGVAPIDALPDAYGGRAEELADDLEVHLRNDDFKGLVVRSADVERISEADIRPLTSGAAAGELAWLAIELERAELARRYFAVALQANPDDAHVHAGLGAAATLDRDFEEAASHYDVALSLAPLDPLVLTAAGAGYAAWAMRADSSGRRDDLVRRAQEGLRQSLAVDPSRPDTLALLAKTYLIEGQDATRGLEILEQAQAQLPSSLEMLLIRARLNMKLGLGANAHYFATNVHSRTHSREQAAEARALLDEIASQRSR
jgi:tetratricopeptide (TPR) repeat protein